MALTKIGATLGGSANVITVTQNSHGLTLGYPVKMTSGGYAHATADSAANAEVVGIIIATSTNTLTIALGGRITVDGCVPNVTAGTVLFLQVSAGLLAATEPSNAGEISKPMAVVTVANSEMIMVQQRGEVLSTGAAAIADGSITSAKITDGTIVNADVNASAAIDATKIADGSVTSTEFQYINTLSSNAQTQISAKQATIDSSARLDASLIGANGNVSNTEYGYLNGVTSAIQTQIDAAGGAVTRVGGQTTEATTTSTGDTDLLTIGSLTIPGATPIHYIADFRKSSGAATDARGGLKLNSTKIGGRTLWDTDGTNEDQTGVAHGIMGGRVTNYLAGMSGGVQTVYKTDVTRRSSEVAPNANDSNPSPTADVTSWIVVGSVGSSSTTLGIAEVHVYTMGVS